MKSTQRILVFLFLSLSMTVQGADMFVSGAGTPETNGLYTNMGTHATLSDDVDYYQMGSNYLFRIDDSGDKIWIIGLVLGDGGFTNACYAGMNASDTPAGLTMEDSGALGTEPYPTINATGSSNNMLVTGAGTALTNGLYTNMGPHTTLSDGVNYYQMGSIYLFRFDLGGDDKIWIIGLVLGDGGAANAYYGGENTGDTPAGMAMETPGALGTEPMPTIGDASLPVELSHFSAEISRDGIHLKWTTQSETDNLGFILERAVETLHATSLQWDVIASYETYSNLMGHGNSSEKHEYTFVDSEIDVGQTYTYRLSDVSTDGEVHIYDVIRITLPEAPLETVLEPPFPNPFNPETKIPYQLAEAGPVEIVVYDLLGRKVQTLVSEEQSTGSYNVYWHGDDMSGRKTATGTYIIVMKSEQGVKTQKVVMLR
ncbi:T9SS type A sorting domain-containing protein [bacterium]|nr:T9SS type A sorting domain-containing protein [bacterium]